MLEHLDEEQLKEAKRGIREYQLAQAEEPPVRAGGFRLR